MFYAFDQTPSIPGLDCYKKEGDSKGSPRLPVDLRLAVSSLVTIPKMHAIYCNKVETF